MKSKAKLGLALVLSLLSAVLVLVFARKPPESAAQNSRLVALHPDGYSFTNHLISEKCPYLVEHAHNPVDWYPWGERAFAKARKENKPIFLSVGYSSCHWCHVMAHESFENPQIARILNDNFVCVLVDREERPDVDRVYLTFVRATTGSGGWPMCVWLTPHLKPFFGGTYFPPEQLAAVSEKIAAAWQTDRGRILASSQSIIRQLQQYAQAGLADTNTVLTPALLNKAYDRIKANYDSRNGGFGRAPKFPQPAILNFLLHYYVRTGSKDALDMVLFALRRMAAGGIHDQLGGGFHRYATDARWRVPHFEKMLYGQAQLANVYLDAYQITRDQAYADVARDTLDYVQRDMTAKDGRFFSAEDADSPLPNDPSVEGEGAFYLWGQKEITAALGRDAARVFDFYYGIEKDGNADNGTHSELQNENILAVAHTVEETAKKLGKSPKQIRKILADARQKLFAIRERRPRPALDNKTITAWNGLMISAFARAHQVLGDPQYLAAATNAAQFIKDKLYDPKTRRLFRSYCAGRASVDGFASDYAFLIQGLLDLYEASFDIRDLAWPEALQKKQNELFWDNSGSGYFSTAGLDTNILLRMKEDDDGAEPSPNSVSALNLLRLGEMLNDKGFQRMAAKTFAAFNGQLQQTPSAMPEMKVALDFYLAKPKQIVIAGHPDAPDTRAMLCAVHAHFVPNKILILADGGPGQAFLGKRLEFIRDAKMIGNTATAYVCEHYVCHLPTTNLNVVARLVSSHPNK